MAQKPHFPKQIYMPACISFAELTEYLQQFSSLFCFYQQRLIIKFSRLVIKFSRLVIKFFQTNNQVLYSQLLQAFVLLFMNIECTRATKQMFTNRTPRRSHFSSFSPRSICHQQKPSNLEVVIFRRSSIDFLLPIGQGHDGNWKPSWKTGELEKLHGKLGMSVCVREQISIGLATRIPLACSSSRTVFQKLLYPFCMSP